MSRPWTVSFVIAAMCAIVFTFTPAFAAPGPNHARVFRTLGTAITIPEEWDGIWSVVDSTYNCFGGPATMVEADEDTICGGETFSDEDFAVSCSGTATGTRIQATCIGSSEIFPNCLVNYNITYDVTRTANSYVSITVVNISYSGTAKGCDLIAPSCTRIVSRGTRSGPAPDEFCLTEVKRETWGKLKILYR